ncbi:hypothetical protein DXG03_005904 [Asterophora parasitica]|uniref:Potassium channel domain-containing protein n=1 Tax=Asterophora parasitica TaxID=117018 RepID=A0A9P7KE38_9AGAR|nr:hypothetical protein DXG03_005904 [Asterophora parasitica]
MPLLPLNIIYQFFFAPSRTQAQPDPEKGSVPVPEPEEVDDRPDTGDTLAEENRAAEEESLPEPRDDNDIIDELEREEYPDTRKRRRRKFASFSTFTLTRKSSAVSWWARLKDVLDPRTSAADVEAYMPHYRYMPIVSGVIIPFSILLEIPGLTEDWYVRTEANHTVETHKNTQILDIALGFSIGFAVLANACLVTRFMEKKVKTMTLLCVLFLTIHDILNTTSVIVFGVEHHADDGFTYGQAFWMTVCSTSVSTLTNVTLVVDLVRTPDFAISGSGLTRKQRTLVISVMTLLAYIAFGALVQTYLIGLTFLNALYFTVVSIETIGFGDIVPNSTGSRVFTCLYSVFGILNLALTVGLTRETVLEGIEVGYRKRVKAMRERRKTVMFERRVFERWRAAITFRLRRIDAPIWVKDSPEQHHHRHCRWAARFIDTVLPWPTGQGRLAQNRYTHTVGYGHYPHPHEMHLNFEALTWVQLEAAAMEVGVPLRNLLPVGFKAKERREAEADERKRSGISAEDGESASGSWSSKGHTHIPVPPELTGMPLTHARLGRMVVMLGNFALAVHHSAFVRVPLPGEIKVAAAIAKRKSEREAADADAQSVDEASTQRARTVAEQYDALRASMADEERKAFYVRLSAVCVAFLLFWFVGAGIFCATEKWSYGTALYFCFIAFTTIGYGDITPKTPAGRSVFIFWALLGVGTVTILISILSDAYSSRYKSIFTSRIITQAIKRYQERARDSKQHPLGLPSNSLSCVSTRVPDTGSTSLQPFSPAVPTIHESPSAIDEALTHSQKRLDTQLESLPVKVLEHARNFGEEAQYLIEPEALDINKEAVPDGLRQLMDDVAGVERLGERIKGEILRDQDARNALLAISIENAFRKIMEIAEEAIQAAKERDRLKGIDIESGNEEMGREQVHLLAKGPIDDEEHRLYKSHECATLNAEEDEETGNTLGSVKKPSTKGQSTLKMK